MGEPPDYHIPEVIFDWAAEVEWALEDENEEDG